MAELKKVEIFKVGTWNGMTFIEADLDDIVENFDELRNVHKVPLKFGHSGERDTPKGMPALGWVSNVIREGKLLLADFTHVPDKVERAIRNKQYRTVSVEIMFGANLGKKVFRHILDAVALLGAEQPAVLGLADLDQFIATADRASFDHAGHRLMFETQAGVRNQSTSGGRMDQADKAEVALMIEAGTKTLMTSISALLGKPNNAPPSGDDDLRKQLRDAQDKLDTAEREAKKLKADREEFDRNSNKAKIDGDRKFAKDLLEAAVKAKEITPAQRDVFTKRWKLDDDEAMKAFDRKEFETMFQTKLPADGSTGASKKPGTDGGEEIEGLQDGETPDLALSRLAYEHMTKANVSSFSRALEAVGRAHPKLHRAYINMNGTKE